MSRTDRGRRNLSFFFYLLYGSVLLSILLVVFFPSRKVRQYCTETVERLIPGTKCSIGSVGYGFPLALRFQDIQLTGAKGDILFSVEFLSVRAELQRPGLYIFARLYDGEYRCRLLMTRNRDTFRLADIEARHLDLGRWEGLQKFLGRNISGFLDFSGYYSWRLGRILGGEAEGMARVHDGSMELLRPILSLNAVTLQDSEIAFQFRNQRLTIKKGNVHGKEFDGIFTGMFQFSLPLTGSILEITGDLTPTPTLVNADQRWKNIAAILRRRYKQSTLPFVVSGTLTSPLFRFGG